MNDGEEDAETCPSTATRETGFADFHGFFGAAFSDFERLDR